MARDPSSQANTIKMARRAWRVGFLGSEPRRPRKAAVASQAKARPAAATRSTPLLVRPWFLAGVGALALALAGPAHADGCDSGCFPLGPGSAEYNACVARCQSYSTSDLDAATHAAFLNDLRGSITGSEQALLNAGYWVCKQREQGVDRSDIEDALVRQTGLSPEGAAYFVGRVLVRLCA